jgi:hypothetical protein
VDPVWTPPPQLWKLKKKIVYPLISSSVSLPINLSTVICSSILYPSTYCHVFGVLWLTITGSGYDDWVYWHFFTITINHNSSQSMTDYDSLHSLLVYECLLFYCDEWRTKNSWLISVAAGTRASELLPSKWTSTSAHCYSGFQAVFTQPLPSKWS